MPGESAIHPIVACLARGEMLSMRGMTENPNPSVRSRQVSTLLRELRENRKLSGADVARVLGMSASKVSRIETGNRGLQVGDVAALLGLYQVPEARRDQILDQVSKSEERGWWESRGLGMPALRKGWADFEARATKIQNYEPLIMPGLLQTDEYAQAWFQTTNNTLSRAELDDLVAARAQRRAVLRNPYLQYLAVIDEAALTRPLAERSLMRRQLRHLVDASERRNVTVRVVPLRVGLYTGMHGGFACLDFPKEPSLVYLENYQFGMFLDEVEATAIYRAALSNILNLALDAVESATLIAQLADDL